MMELKLKPSLEKFLKEKGAYDAYMDNLMGQYYAKDYQDWADSFCEEAGEDCITAAFVFFRTPEGVDYWYKLAREFDEIDRT